MIKHIFTVETKEELLAYQAFVKEIRSKLETYIFYLQKNYAVEELPRSIVWTSGEIATQLISNIPVPAYTNEYRTVITPDMETWRHIYLRQLDGLRENDEAVRIVREYYSTALNKNHILQILGHELAHHSEWFPDDFDEENDSGIWFEEGMVEYISRKYFLTEEEFAEEARMNQLLVDLLIPRYGDHPLEAFGAATYAGDYVGIFFEYWRSFLAVKRIVDRQEGDIHKVFGEYHRWHAASQGMTLEEWFRGL